MLTVSGPIGSGKGTIAQLLAARLGWRCLDSGALYRIVGAVALQWDIGLDDADGLAAMAGELDEVEITLILVSVHPLCPFRPCWR